MSELTTSKLYFLLSLSVLLTPSISLSLPKPNSASNPKRIWASSPAVNWNDSFLIGNGRLGAVVGGVVLADVIHVNEDSFWSGGPLHRVNPDAATQMPFIQRDIREGGEGIGTAATLASYAYAGTPVSTQHYDPIGDLTLTMDDGLGNVTDYERWLDLGTGTTGVWYSVEGVTYEREYLASEPAGLIAIRISASQEGAVSFHLHLDRGESLNRWEDYTEKVGSYGIVMGGASGGLDPIQYAAGAKIVAPDGNVSTLGDYVFCKNATEAWVYLQAWTSFRQVDPKTAILNDLAAATEPYTDIRTDHLSDYQSLFNRSSLSLGTSTAAQRNMSTGTRVIALNSTFDPELASLYYQFGRYLLISTSRANTLPPNLQGIWNSDFDPEWGSKYTVNINLQMNYWPSLVTNLADLASPLYDLIERMRTNGFDVARTMYNCSGTIAHHNTDLWADCAPQDNSLSSTFWPSGLAWLSTQIMQDYLFTGNTTSLASHYPVLQDVLTFYLTFLTPGPNDWLVTNPSLSPENLYYLPNSTEEQAITMGPTLDNSLIWELIGYALEAMDILSINDTTFTSQLLNLRSRLPPIQISYFGGVQEWIYDYKEQDPAHRHFSPLFGLYPGSQITSANATSFNAAKQTLLRRLTAGGGDTGWSRAWAISLSARSFLNYEVHASLMHLLTQLTHPIALLDTGPPAPFQIDGNFGGTAGVAEALVQSHELVSESSNGTATVADGKFLTPAYRGERSGTKTILLRLLPALPVQWAKNGGGEARGLRARGGFEIDVRWDEQGRLTGANITSSLGQKVWVTVGSETIGSDAARTNVTGGDISVNGAERGRFVLLASEVGGRYSVTLA